MRICGQNQPSDAEFDEICVSMTGVECCYGRIRIRISSLFGLHRQLDEKLDYNEKL